MRALTNEERLMLREMKAEAAVTPPHDYLTHAVTGPDADALYDTVLVTLQMRDTIEDDWDTLTEYEQQIKLFADGLIESTNLYEWADLYVAANPDKENL